MEDARPGKATSVRLVVLGLKCGRDISQVGSALPNLPDSSCVTCTDPVSVAGQALCYTQRLTSKPTLQSPGRGTVAKYGRHQ